jgi:excisionase family DNA binding protein
MRNETDLLRVPEVAQLLRVRASTVYTWTEAGILPSYRVGRLLRFSRTEIEEWLADRATAGDRGPKQLRGPGPEMGDSLRVSNQRSNWTGGPHEPV